MAREKKEDYCGHSSANGINALPESNAPGWWIPMIELILVPLERYETLDQIVVVTSWDSANKPLIDHVIGLGYTREQGSENDVLSRYIAAIDKYSPTAVVRITADCPLVDPLLVDECVTQFYLLDVDYFSNINPPSFPDGLDVEVVKAASLKSVAAQTKDKVDREHVTPFLRRSDIYKKANLENFEDLSELRWTVDDPEDLVVLTNILARFAQDYYVSWQDVLGLYRTNPELFSANSKLSRDQGANMGTGQKLWQRAKHVIPGGNMLLSKRAEMFLPTNGRHISIKPKVSGLDLDDKEYIDMSIMGIGTNILGYAHPEVDEAVAKVVESSNMSTLNCPEEVYFAERLVDLHPWADMARLARSGGEANSIAVRIARAATGKDKVAICGYHGWHDWYLATNLAEDDGLDGHLLPGLQPNGVPRGLQGTVLPFNYNCIDELRSLIAAHDIGVIKMEVVRNKGPENDFLQEVRRLATTNNIVLIFDECTSGFRETFGGIHKKYGVEPDMAMFGKAMGNGYAITATIAAERSWRPHNQLC